MSCIIFFKLIHFYSYQADFLREFNIDSLFIPTILAYVPSKLKYSNLIGKFSYENIDSFITKLSSNLSSLTLYMGGNAITMSKFENYIAKLTKIIVLEVKKTMSHSQIKEFMLKEFL